MTKLSARGPLVLLALGVLAAFFCLQLRIDNRHDRLISSSNQEAIDYQAFLDTFGSDEFIIVALSGKPLFDEESLDAMLEALERLEAIPEVTHVNGLPTIFRDRFGAEDPEELEDEITSTLFYQGLILSPDQKVTGLLVEPQIMETARVRRDLVEGVREAIAPLVEYGFRVDLVGGPVFSTTINRLSMTESLRAFPVAAIASLAVLLLLVRSVKAAGVVIICGLLTLLLTLGLVGATGRPLNLITTALPLVLWVLAIANCIHLVTRYQRHTRKGLDPIAAIGETLDELRFSCSLSAITTALGFFSLTVADIVPIRELGVYVGLGMLISLGVNLVLAPYLIVAFRVPGPKRLLTNHSRLLEPMADWVIRHPRPIVLAFAVLVAVGGYSMTQIKSESNSLKFLPEDSEVVLAYDFVAENLTGMYTLEIVFDTPDSWLEPIYWEPITALADRIAASPIVSRVVTPLDFLKKMNQWDHDLEPEHYVLPETRAEAEALMDLLEDEDRVQIDRFATPDEKTVRMSVMMNSMNARDFEGLITLAKAEVARLPEPMSGTVTGMAARMQVMSVGLVKTQFKSYITAFILIFVSILVGLRSFKITLISILPNIVPLLSAFTTMALLGISLDAATVMVASISLGIAVDDTVHFLAGYQRHRDRGEGNHAAIRSTLSTVGPSITVTTVTACIGFFALCQSSFVAIRYFGLLSGIAILMALVADLLLVPAMFAWRGEGKAKPPKNVL